MEPPVDSAMARCGKSATAVTTAAPPELPPGLLSVSRGLRGTLYGVFTLKVPNPNSSWVVFPRMAAPSSRHLATTVASKGGV